MFRPQPNMGSPFYKERSKIIYRYGFLVMHNKVRRMLGCVVPLRWSDLEHTSRIWLSSAIQNSYLPEIPLSVYCSGSRYAHIA